MKQLNEPKKKYTHTHTHNGSALKSAIRTSNSSRGASAIKRDMIQQFYISFFLCFDDETREKSVFLASISGPA
jgi:hypothetical protein